MVALGRISSSLSLLADLSVGHATLPRSIHTLLKNASYSAALFFLLSSVFQNPCRHLPAHRSDSLLVVSYQPLRLFSRRGVRSAVPSTLFHILPAHQHSAPERRNESSKPNSRQPHCSTVITKPPLSPPPKTPHHSSLPCSST